MNQQIELSKFILMEELHLNESLLALYLEEEACLESGSLSDIISVNEGVFETVKNFVITIINKIIEMWNKFIGKIKEILPNDKKFLEANKKIIFNKKYDPDTEIKMYEYDLKLLESITVPPLNYNQMKDSLKDEATFAAKFIQGIDVKPDEKGAVNINSIIAKAIRKSDQPVAKKATELDWQGMYDFAYNFENTQKNIQTIISNLETSKTNALNIAKSSAVKNEAAEDLEVYSALKGRFIHEVEINQPEKKEEPQATDNNAVEGDTSKQDDDKLKKDVADSGDKTDEVTKAINVYFKVAAAVAGSKMTLAMEIRKEYMQVIKWHVGRFSKGEKDEEKKDDNVGADKTPEEVKPATV